MAFHPQTVFTRTTKGVREARTSKLPRELSRVFSAVDGKAPVADVVAKSGVAEGHAQLALDQLTTEGYIRIFSVPDGTDGLLITSKIPMFKAPAVAQPVIEAIEGEEELDFTSDVGVAKVNAEATQRGQAEAEARQRAEAAAQAAAKSKVRQEAEMRARVIAEARMKAESEARQRAEAEAKARAEAAVKAAAEAKAAADTKARAEAEARLRVAMEAKVRAEAEVKTRTQAEEAARLQAKANERAEAEAKASADSEQRTATEAMARAEAEAKARGALEAQMKAMSQALDQARKLAADEAAKRKLYEAETRARAEAEHSALQEAQQRATAAELAIAEARAMAEEAARAKTEAESRALSGDVNAQARVQQAMKALEDAKARAVSEAEAKGKAEARAQMEAELRKVREAESGNREAEITKVREQAEQQSRAIVRELQEQAKHAKAEAEASALSEQAARAEIEARAQAQIREVRAQAAKAQAESAAQTDAERKARLEAEARADSERATRDEAIQKARSEAETKARAEIEAQMASEKKARAAAEAKAAAEQAIREQAEKKVMFELATKITAERKAREQAEQQTRLAQQAREEAEKRLLNTPAGNPEEIRKANERAQAAADAAEEAVARANAIAEQATMAKAEAEERVRTEKTARAAAEDRAKAEAVQRLMQEQQSKERAEQDISLRVALELKQREQAERAADIKERAAAEERARKFAAEQKAHSDQAAPTPKSTGNSGKGKNKAVIAAVSVVVLITAALGLLHIIPLSGYVPAVQDIMSKHLGAPVSIGTMRYELFPSAQLTLERVTIGKLQDIKISTLYVPVGPIGLVSGARSFDTIEGKGVNVETSALAAINKWADGAKADPEVRIAHLKLRQVKIATQTETPTFDVDATLGARGELQKATLSADKARLDLTPKDKSWSVALTASDWKPFVGPRIEFGELEVTGIITGDRADISAIKGRVAGGALSGQMKLDWSGALQATGDLKLEGVRLAGLMPMFTRGFSAAGTLGINANYALSGDSVKTLFDAARVEGAFVVESGELNNVDIVRAIQGARAGGQRGGKTRFDKLSGTVQVNGARTSYRQLQLNSGPMNASGAVDVADGGTLSGNVNAELGSKGVVVARGNLGVTGSVKDPVLR